MSKNDIIQQKKTEQKVSTGRKIGFLCLSLIPVAVILMIQTIAQVPFLILAVTDAVKLVQASSGTLEIYDLLLDIFNEKYSSFAYLAYVVIGLIVFGIWYYKGFVKKQPKVKFGEVFGVKSVSAVLCIGVGLFFVINAVLTLAEKLFPLAMQNYSEMIESVGIVTNPVITIAYAILLGPVLEELCFRGVVFGFLEKSGAGPAATIVISAILFGAIHLIPVQVVYAAFFGLFLGFLRYKYRSIKISILAHILFNFMGTYVSDALLAFNPSEGLLYIFGGLSMFLLVLAILLIMKDKKAVHS